MKKLLIVTSSMIVLGLCILFYWTGYAVSEQMHSNPIVIRRVYLPEDISAYKTADSMVGVMRGDTVIIDFYYPSHPFTSAK